MKMWIGKFEADQERGLFRVWLSKTSQPATQEDYEVKEYPVTENIPQDILEAINFIATEYPNGNGVAQGGLIAIEI